MARNNRGGEKKPMSRLSLIDFTPQEFDEFLDTLNLNTDKILELIALIDFKNKTQDTLQLPDIECIEGNYILPLGMAMYFSKQKAALVHNKLGEADFLEATIAILAKWFSLDIAAAVEVVGKLFVFKGHVASELTGECTLRVELEFKSFKEAVAFKLWLEGPQI